jgi:hypothetical protein
MASLYFVDILNIDDSHGDAHADDLFCAAIRKAEVVGEVIETDSKLLPTSISTKNEGIKMQLILQNMTENIYQRRRSTLSKKSKSVNLKPQSILLNIARNLRAFLFCTEL